MRKFVNGKGTLTWMTAVLLITAAASTAASSALAQAPVDHQLRSYADVAETTMPAVVNISTDKLVDNSMGQHPFMNDPMFKRFFNMPDDDVHNQPERLEHSLGSGIVISADGYILTNNHVVENASKVRVTFVGEREYEAEVIGTDPPTDVALIKIDAENLPTVRVGDSDQLRVGDQVMAIGNPFGVGQTVTLGIVSALGRNIGLMDYADLIQTDASINPGNSGGALVNMRGELVGMNAAILSRSGGSQGIGFAIPTSMAMRIVDSLKESGTVQRAYLGVLPQPVDQSMADYYGMDRPRGVLITQVNEDTPAEKAGLMDGDIILSVDGREIRNPSMLRNVISLSEVGQDVELAIVREGKEQNITVRLDKFPDPEQMAAADVPADPDEDETLDGVVVREMTPRMRTMMETLPEDIEGLIVTGVEQTSNAAREGLAEGDIIQKVGGETVTTLKAFQGALGKNTDRPVFLRVYKPRQQQSIFIAVPR
ncbi:MAG: DegQ family serine endoprotease [Candidatus Krumholzibacteriota bacterium]